MDRVQIRIGDTGIEHAARGGMGIALCYQFAWRVHAVLGEDLVQDAAARQLAMSYFLIGDGLP